MWPIQNLAGMIMGAQQGISQPISQWIQNETLGGNIWGWLTLLFLSAKRKWVLILKHEFPLETVSLNEHLKLQIVFFFEAAQNHIVVIFWFLSQPQIFKCQNLAKPPANVCHGNWPTKTANSNESLHSGSVLKLHQARGAGTHLCPCTVPFCRGQLVCSRLGLCAEEGSRLSPTPRLFLPFYQCLASAANPTFALLSAPSFQAVFKLRGLDVLLRVVLTWRTGKWEQY